MTEKKTSEEWLKVYNIPKEAIIAYGGWDIKNSFYYSFFREKITLKEMRERVDKSKINIQFFGGTGFFKKENN